jgi:tRNA (uracil-5-)-methyltransferase TRM9
MNQEIKDVYTIISKSFDRTRSKIWNCVKEFLNLIEVGKNGLEVGCGNGKNLRYRQDLKFEGIDISQGMVELCQKKGLNVSLGDMLSLPFKDNSFDFILSVASLHHLASVEKRKKAIAEMIRVCKKGGKIFILVWAFEQPSNSRRKFETQDEMVDWFCPEDEKRYFRYYHLYRQGELEEEIICSFKDNFQENYNLKIEKSFYEAGNWGVRITFT